MTASTDFAVCLNCDRPITDLERTWVRSPISDDLRVWFLCPGCLEDEVRVNWSADGPTVHDGDT